MYDIAFSKSPTPVERLSAFMVAAKGVSAGLGFRFKSVTEPNERNGTPTVIISADTISDVRDFFRKVGDFAAGHPIRDTAQAIGDFKVIPQVPSNRTVPALGVVKELIKAES